MAAVVNATVPSLALSSSSNRNGLAPPSSFRSDFMSTSTRLGFPVSVSRRSRIPTITVSATPDSEVQELDDEYYLNLFNQPTYKDRKAAARRERKAKESELDPTKQKVRIKLRSYWTHLLTEATNNILECAKETGAKISGPIPLPTKRRLYCVLRSPHVDKDSRDHFEIRTHRRLIELKKPSIETLDALMQLNVPAGVDVEVKLY